MFKLRSRIEVSETTFTSRCFEYLDFETTEEYAFGDSSLFGDEEHICGNFFRLKDNDGNGSTTGGLTRPGKTSEPDCTDVYFFSPGFFGPDAFLSISSNF
jgi:hypothetical protein